MRDNEFIRFLLDKKCLFGNNTQPARGQVESRLCLCLAQQRQQPSTAFVLTSLKA